MPPLSILIWLPALCGVLGAIIPSLSSTAPRDEPDRRRRLATRRARHAERRLEHSRRAGADRLGGALGLAIGYIADFHSGGPALQHVTDIVWISELGIHYKLGVSGLNVFLVGLTTLLFAAATLAANLRSWERPKLFYFHFMLAESAVLGAFLAQDLALFVAFFDLMLIPFYFLIGGWGTGARPGESDDQARDLHARRLAADARRRDRHRRAGRPSRAAGTSRSCSPSCRRCR